MDLLELGLWIGLFTTIVLLIIVITTKKTKTKKKTITQGKLEEMRSKRNLKDPRLYDPHTDVYITLEEAEAGSWEVNDFKKRTKEELHSYFTETEIINFQVREELQRQGFTKAEEPFPDGQEVPLSDKQYEIIEQLAILNKEDSWSYNNSFFRNKLRLLFLNIYNETQLMIWLSTAINSGHYVFQEKTIMEKFFDLLRDDDDIKNENFECYTLEKGSRSSVSEIQKILDAITEMKNVEIEILPYHLFVKTTIPLQFEHLLKLLKLAKDYEYGKISRK